MPSVGRTRPDVVRTRAPNGERARASNETKVIEIPPFASYLLLVTIVFLAEAGVPLLMPTELVLIAAGIAAARGDASLHWVLVLTLTADRAGTMTLFAGVRRARRLDGRAGQADRLITRIAHKARAMGADVPTRVAVARSLPLVRLPVAAAAALTDLHVARYLAAAFAGGCVWVSGLVIAGYVLTPG